MYKIIENKKSWFLLSSILIGLSFLALLIWGLKLGIDFKGGSLLEITYEERPIVNEIEEVFINLELNNVKIQPSGNNKFILRFENVDENIHQDLIKSLKELEDKEESSFQELRFESIGPIIGQELKTKALKSIIIVLIFIILYIAYAFRKVSQPLTSWKFGLAAIIALAHDLIIIIGVFSLLGHYFNIEIDSLFVTALLTILGFSVHDTIVTFDRTRENLFKYPDKRFSEIVNLSVNQTIIRSLNTSFTTLFVLLAIYIFGGESIKNFVLALILGVLIGTYSSIFIASPLLTSWNKKSS